MTARSRRCGDLSRDTRRATPLVCHNVAFLRVLTMAPTTPRSPAPHHPPVPGGLLEITGIMSVLYRGVEHILVCDTSMMPLDDDGNLKSLFGLTPDVTDGSFDPTHNTIFRRADYDAILAALHTEMDAGRFPIASADVVTVTNNYWGIKAGMRVHLTWIYLHAAQDWLDRLPDETRHA